MSKSQIFEQIGWYGVHQGGFPVLKPFSLSHDFNNPAKSLMYFAETSHRALLYATRDFAGGEKLRALRYALSDLEAYCDDAELRQEHNRHLDELRLHPPSQATEIPSWEIDLDWLKSELDQLSDVKYIAHQAVTRHEYGLVYAISVTPDDMQHLRYSQWMGIETHLLLPSSRIVAKTVIEPDCQWNPFAPPEQFIAWLQGALGMAIRSKNA